MKRRSQAVDTFAAEIARLKDDPQRQAQAIAARVRVLQAWEADLREKQKLLRK